MILATTILALDEKEIQAATVPPITFAVTALLVIAIILLGVDLVRRIRRAQYREEIEQELAAEIAERDAKQAAASTATADEAGAASEAGPEAATRPEAEAETPEGTMNNESDRPQA